MSDDRKRRVRCAHCGRKMFDSNGMIQHMKAKHPKMPRAHLYPEREESIADLFVQAEINRAMGVQNPEWLEAMLP